MEWVAVKHAEVEPSQYLMEQKSMLLESSTELNFTEKQSLALYFKIQSKTKNKIICVAWFHIKKFSYSGFSRQDGQTTVSLYPEKSLIESL